MLHQNNNDLTNKSKFLSLILRHKPEKYDIILDKNGWAPVSALIEKGYFTKEELMQIVATDGKKRYSFNDDASKIRANQGHSIEVDVQLKPIKPPTFLYHGTYHSVSGKIMEQGIYPMNRLYVHLSKDIATAKVVGQRRGKPVVMKIDAEQMYKDKCEFFVSENEVYLTKEVKPKYITKVITDFKNLIGT